MEIPPEQQKLVKSIFIWWVVHCVFYISNFVLAFVGMITIIAIGQNPSVNGTFFANFGLALALVLLFLPASLFCLYLPLYRAFRSDSSMNFMCFFFVCVFQFGIYLCHGFGIPGGCGMILCELVLPYIRIYHPNNPPNVTNNYCHIFKRILNFLWHPFYSS